MFIAMNRFKIVLGKEMDFEKVWRERDTHLEGTKGFKEFHLVKGEKNNIIPKTIDDKKMLI